MAARNNKILVCLVLVRAAFVNGSCSVSYSTRQRYSTSCGFWGSGRCTRYRNVQRYRCCVGWTGSTCATDIDECASNPCVNGECQDGINGYTCLCEDGWTGDICDTDLEECFSNPCLNGECQDGINAYTCLCNDGWTGDTCDTDINECVSNPCKNGGECFDGTNQYTCTCSAGWMGDTCDIDINECVSNPCKNGGECSHGTNQYVCTCSAGWNGDNCDIDIDECVSSPCENSGECSHGTNQYTCTCSAGWMGDNCDIDINECVSNPCKNGAECSHETNQYTCTCSAGWMGDNCDIEISECDSNPCVNGVCQDGIDQYTCKCNTGWIGTKCNRDIEQPTPPDVKAGLSVIIEFDILPKYVTNVLIATESVPDRKKRQNNNLDGVSKSTIVANLTRSDIDESMSFTLGDSKTYGGYVNHALVPGGSYSLKIAYASCTPEVDCAVVWSPPAVIRVPDCSVEFCSELNSHLNSLNSRNDNGYNVMILGGSIVVICIVAVFILGFIIDRRLRRSRSTPQESSTPNEEYEEIDPQTTKEADLQDDTVYEVNLAMADTKKTNDYEFEDEELVYEDINI